MKVKIIYPAQDRISLLVPRLREALKWCLSASVAVCPVINLCTGGKPWSVIVLFGAFMLWSLVLSPDIVQYNLISQTSKLLAYSCVLLLLIDMLLAPGWAAFVIPIVSFSGLALIAVMFFADIKKHRQNMMPMLWVAAISAVSVAATSVAWSEISWPMIVLGCIAAAVVVLSVSVLGKGVFREIKKYFHT